MIAVEAPLVVALVLNVGASLYSRQDRTPPFGKPEYPSFSKRGAKSSPSRVEGVDFSL
jgi:hypothetical protein